MSFGFGRWFGALRQPGGAGNATARKLNCLVCALDPPLLSQSQPPRSRLQTFIDPRATHRSSEGFPRMSGFRGFGVSGFLGCQVSEFRGFWGVGAGASCVQVWGRVYLDPGTLENLPY